MVNAKKNDLNSKIIDTEIKEPEDKNGQDGLQQKLDEAVNGWKRALADYQNLEKRIALEKQENNKYHARRLLEKLLEVLDLLIAAKGHINDSGLDLVVKKFEDVIAEEGLKRIETADQVFDPKTMECLETVDGDSDNMVSEELVSGFVFNDGDLVRPAKVKVYRKKLSN